MHETISTTLEQILKYNLYVLHLYALCAVEVIEVIIDMNFMTILIGFQLLKKKNYYSWGILIVQPVSLRNQQQQNKQKFSAFIYLGFLENQHGQNYPYRLKNIYVQYTY